MSFQAFITDRSGEDITSFEGEKLAELEDDSRKFIKTLFRESGPYQVIIFNENKEVVKQSRIMGGRFTSSARALERSQNIRLGKPDPTGPGIIDVNPITQEELDDIQHLQNTEPIMMRGIARDDFNELIERKRRTEKREMRKMTMMEFFKRET